MIILKDLIRNFYPHQYIYIYNMNNKSTIHTTTDHLSNSNHEYLTYEVRTIEIYRDELGKLKDILKVFISK